MLSQECGELYNGVRGLRGNSIFKNWINSNTLQYNFVALCLLVSWLLWCLQLCLTACWLKMASVNWIQQRFEKNKCFCYQIEQNVKVASDRCINIWVLSLIALWWLWLLRELKKTPLVVPSALVSFSSGAVSYPCLAFNFKILQKL